MKSLHKNVLPKLSASQSLSLNESKNLNKSLILARRHEIQLLNSIFSWIENEKFRSYTLHETTQPSAV